MRRSSFNHGAPLESDKVEDFRQSAGLVSRTSSAVDLRRSLLLFAGLLLVTLTCYLLPNASGSDRPASISSLNPPDGSVSSSFRRIQEGENATTPVNSTTTSPFAAIPIYSHDLVMTEEGRHELIIAEEAKLLYCSVPKSACSQMRIMMSRLLGYSTELAIQQLHENDTSSITNIGGVFFHEWLKWPTPADGGVKGAEQAMADPQTTRFIVVRDPIERFISGFVDKCLEPAKKGEPYNWNCPLQEPSRSNITAVFLEMKRQADNMGKAFVNEHFRPQSLFCDIRTYRDRYKVIPYSQLKEKLVDLADNVLVERERVIYRNQAHMTPANLAQLYAAIADEIKQDAARGGPPPRFINGTLTQEYAFRLIRQMAMAAVATSPSFPVGTVKEAVLDAANHLRPYSSSVAQKRIDEHLADKSWLRDALREFYREDYLFFGDNGF
jgi:Sulfotransferase family